MPDTYSLTSRIPLNDGNSYPRFGLGVYVTEPGEETYNAVTWALEAGYRHIDGAEWYENEADCGRAINDFIAKSGTPRSEIYFTTKLMHNRTDPAWVEKCVDVSLKKAGLDYIDLYLIHDPNGGPDVRAAMWEGCCRVKDSGKVRSIGVSNFGVKHLEDLLARKPKYIPAVNQIDLHPFMTRVELVKYCQSKNIVLEAWAPLVRGERFDHPVIVELAKKYNKSPAQILIRYGLDSGFIVIPKSTKKNRIADNANVFDFVLEKEDLDRLLTLDEFLVTDWEVSTVP
ncbi:aldo-keto reductase [Rhodotorula sp. JG-1b]|nr:aldo-keto reductase [Rhodotorula sp. JG-1b]